MIHPNQSPILSAILSRCVVPGSKLAKITVDASHSKLGGICAIKRRFVSSKSTRKRVTFVRMQKKSFPASSFFIPGRKQIINQRTDRERGGGGG